MGIGSYRYIACSLCWYFCLPQDGLFENLHILSVNVHYCLGPCGPCSELYYDFYPERGTQDADLNDDSRFIEFYNLVFMELNRDAAGNLTALKAKNIDTGMGLERMAQILQQVPNNYETDLMYPIVEVAARIAGFTYADALPQQQRDLKARHPIIGITIGEVSAYSLFFGYQRN